MGGLGSTEQLVELLGKAEDLFGGSHSLDEYFRGVCDLMVPALADWCEISLADDGKLIPQASRYVDPEAKVLDGHPRELDAHSIVRLPLTVRDRVIGAVSLANTHERARLSQSDLMLARAILTMLMRGSTLLRRTWIGSEEGAKKTDIG